MPTVGAGFFRCFPSVKQAKLFSIALFVIISVAPRHFVVQVLRHPGNRGASQSIGKADRFIRLPIARVGKGAGGLGNSSLGKKQGGKYGKDVLFYHIWFGFLASLRLHSEPRDYTYEERNTHS